MPTAIAGCMCVQSTMVEGICIMQIQPKGHLSPEAILTQYNVTMATYFWVQICAKFDAHEHYLCQVINSNRY